MQLSILKNKKGFTKLFLTNFEKSHEWYFRKTIQDAKREHDDAFWATDFDNVASQPHMINNSPYYLENGHETDQEKKLKDQELYYSSNFENLAENFTYSVPLYDSTINSAFFHLRKRSRKLCLNKVGQNKFQNG